MGKSSKIQMADMDKVTRKDKEEREGGISAHMALISFLKGMIGPGCFSLPLVFKQAGLWTGFALVFFFGFLTCYCMHKLVKCAQYLSKRYGKPSLNYGEMANEACTHSFPSIRPYARSMRWVVDAFLILLQIGVCSVFYVFVVEHAKELGDYYAPSSPLPLQSYFPICLPFFVALCWLRSIRAVAYVSLAGNILMVAALAVILQALFLSTHTLDLPWVTDFDGAVMAAGSILYSFEGQAMVLPLENRLRHPVEMGGWTGVLPTGMSLVTIVYVSCGFYGYITFGDNVAGSITLNLPDSPINVAVKIMLMLVVYSGFLIQQYVIVEMVWPSVSSRFPPSSPRLLTLAELAFRAILVAIAMCIGLSVPNLSQIIPLVGVSCGMLLALVFPPILHIVTFLPAHIDKGGLWCTATLSHLLPNLACVLIGLFFLVSGLQSNIVSLVSN